MIKNFTLAYVLLLFIPFVAIISYKIHPAAAYLGVLLLTLPLLFFTPKLNQISKTTFIFSMLMFFALYLSFAYQLIMYDFNNFYYIQFFGSQVFFYFIFTFFVNIELLCKKYLKTFLIFMIIIIFAFILFDYLLIKIGMESSQLMYHKDATSYHGKAQGLFGQFSITTTYVIVFYMLYLSFEQEKNKFKTFLFFLVTITIVLEDSGTGYIVYFLLLTVLLYQSKIIRYFIPLLFLLLAFIVQNNLLNKISYNYLSFLYGLFYDTIIKYISNIHYFGDFMFGWNASSSIDFGPMYMIAQVGWLYFMLYSIAIFTMLYKAPDRYFKMSIISLLFANTHYPVFFYPINNVLLPILFIYVFNLKKRKENLNYIKSAF